MSNPCYLLKGKQSNISLSFYTRKEACKQYNLSNTPRTGTIGVPLKKEISQFVEKFNQNKPNSLKSIVSSDLLRLDFLDATFAHLCLIYDKKINPSSFKRAYKTLELTLGKLKLKKIDLVFKEIFPLPSYSTNPESIFYEQVRDWILLTLKMNNPALQSFQSLFSDKELRKRTQFRKVPFLLFSFFLHETPLLEKEGSLLEMLTKPAKLFPKSLKKQVDYVLEHWRSLLNTKLLARVVQIEEIARGEAIYFTYLNIGRSGFDSTYHLSLSREGIYYSQDSSWMPTVVMMAKSTLVWLSQLSRIYKRPIHQLQDIPNEELDRLRNAGFTALWLIGLWKRSLASQKIKQIMGNSEAQASAYSLKEYEISEELGGWSGLENLKRRAQERGIRLASDMVPNHTGIDSCWIYDHPDYFLQLDHNPYHSYSFQGKNLSHNPDISIKIEDGYYDTSDASIVFQYKNLKTGKTRYIYHGNDGTSVPWNDTAQLDFLKSEVREAVIGEILKIARVFPIIRFDAAMVLAKKQIQRLWHPLLNEKNTIPSREQYGMSEEAFNQLMPKEFWRELVDKVTKEAPDTLLLAEAFWMLEGYFVRTLGMHRVYNSAFMNMLKMEKNAEYRNFLKEVLATDPQILRRFVNFMSNPDEDTAIAQFGADDKYFGVCTLMVTLPGLPMFGHGQIEGFIEKYGMEYSRDYYQEIPNEHILDRHQREIFPLLQKRALFSEIDSFVLYDFITECGINENVFAYSNFSASVASLVIYNNSWKETNGFLSPSPILQEKISFKNEENSFIFLFDKMKNLWFIYRSDDFKKGLFFRLSSYSKKIFIYLHERKDNSQRELENLYQRYRNSGFKGSIEENLSLYKKENSLLGSWSGLYEINYLENWTNYNLEGETLKNVLKEKINSFFSLYAGNYLTDNQKKEISQTIDGFWIRIQYLNKTLRDFQESIPLEVWLSPAGLVFVYDQLYKAISPLITSFSKRKISKNFLEQEKFKALSKFWKLSNIFLNILPVLEKESLNLIQDWNSLLKETEIPIFLSQKKEEFPKGISPSKILISTKAWLSLLKSFEKDEKARQVDKMKLQNFLFRNFDPN